MTVLFAASRRMNSPASSSPAPFADVRTLSRAAELALTLPRSRLSPWMKHSSEYNEFVGGYAHAGARALLETVCALPRANDRLPFRDETPAGGAGAALSYFFVHRESNGKLLMTLARVVDNPLPQGSGLGDSHQRATFSRTLVKWLIGHA